MSADPAFRRLTIIAKDPGLRIGPNKALALVEVQVAAEKLAKGPTGYRIKVVDYNATEGLAYDNACKYQADDGSPLDPFAAASEEERADPAYQARLIGDPNFHAQNVYAIAMRTLGFFERALGRRVGWSSGGHQLHIAPHAFAQANAFYSEPDRSLMFGYFHTEQGEPVFTSLSHDIVAHETTHALLDGLRSRYTEASLPDQAAFHEGFADIVALLSVFSLQAVVKAALNEDGSYSFENSLGAVAPPAATAPATFKLEELYSGPARQIPLIDRDRVSCDALKHSVFFGLGRQFGRALNGSGELRRSILREPHEFEGGGIEEHDLGELIVAVVMRAFVTLWSNRIERLGTFGGKYNLDMVVEEGAKVAGQLLTMCIRGLDYCPPTDLDFAQFIAAVLTSDREIAPDDTRFGYRQALRDAAAEYGIVPSADDCDPAEGCWKLFAPPQPLSYMRSNYAAMTRSKDELFRFLWENREQLGISERAYTEVLSIDTAQRLGPDGIFLTETICQYIQRADLFGAETRWTLGCERPEGMSPKERVSAFGGGVLILDQYGQVKYHIATPLFSAARQRARLAHLGETGGLDARARPGRMRFAVTHLERMGA